MGTAHLIQDSERGAIDTLEPTGCIGHRLPATIPADTHTHTHTHTHTLSIHVFITCRYTQQHTLIHGYVHTPSPSHTHTHTSAQMQLSLCSNESPFHSRDSLERVWVG